MMMLQAKARGLVVLAMAFAGACTREGCDSARFSEVMQVTTAD